MWAAQHYPFDRPRRWVTSGGLGSMGFGLPAALGAQVALPADLGVVVSSGTRDRADLQAEAALWLRHWEGRDERPWRLHSVRIEGGTHAANSTDAYRAGMLWLLGEDRDAP